MGVTYLAGNDFVESHKGEGLRHHGAGEVLFRQHDRDQEGAEGQLRDEGEGFEVPAAGGRWGRG